MNDNEFDPKRLEELLFSSANEKLAESDRTELNELLRNHAEARRFAVQHLSFDTLLAESLAAKSARRHFENEAETGLQTSRKSIFNRRNWLVRAAAWVGALHLFNHPAKAAAAILMKKTITSVTTAILVLGGVGIYVIHRSNESSKARMETMESEIQALNTQLGIKSTRSTERHAGSANLPKIVGISQIIAVFESGNNRLSQKDMEIVEQFRNQLATMDAESLQSMLLDAEKISNPVNGHVAAMIMDAFIPKDPARATKLATLLNGRGLAFQFQLSHSAADAFRDWLAKEPAAADDWYASAAASGELESKNIPPNGLQHLAIDRSFARLRFGNLVKSNFTQAVAMLTNMLPADVTTALQGVTDPNALQQILPKLAPAQQGPAAEGAIKAMAAADLSAAFTWAKSLQIDEQARSGLMATGIEAAVNSRKLDLAGVSDLAKTLDLDAKRRSKLLVSAVTNLSLIPRANENVINVENSVHWDRVAERVDWLRKEAPAESASNAVGEYLGQLAYNSHDLNKSLEAYQSAVAKQGKIDQDLTFSFVRRLSLLNDDKFGAAALKLLQQLPPSDKRDQMIRAVEMNR